MFHGTHSPENGGVPGLGPGNGHTGLAAAAGHSGAGWARGSAVMGLYPQKRTLSFMEQTRIDGLGWFGATKI